MVGRLFFGLNPDWLHLVLRPFADKQRRMAALSCAAAASEVTSLPRLRQAQRACTSASSLAAPALAAAPSGCFLLPLATRPDQISDLRPRCRPSSTTSRLSASRSELRRWHFRTRRFKVQPLRYSALAVYCLCTSRNLFATNLNMFTTFSCGPGNRSHETAAYTVAVPLFSPGYSLPRSRPSSLCKR